MLCGVMQWILVGVIILRSQKSFKSLHNYWRDFDANAASGPNALTYVDLIKITLCWKPEVISAKPSAFRNVIICSNPNALTP